VIRKATIIILTVPLNRANAITDNTIRSAALHEAGHALGLFGHSPNPQDARFFSGRIKDEKPVLTARDSKTLLRLYSQN
jgi:predicted Zn-dependent protease